MKAARWLLATLFLYQMLYADPNSLPEGYAKTSLIYGVFENLLFDTDSAVKEIGLNVYACRLENENAKISYYGLGPCLFDSINYTIKEKKPSAIVVWVLNDKGLYLPPLRLTWQHSHSGWIRFGKEFIYLAFEKLSGLWVSRANNINDPAAAVTCAVDRPIKGDIGNFIGNLSIAFPKGQKLSDYFVLKSVQGEKTETATLNPIVPIVDTLDKFKAESVTVNTTMPFYLNKKRVYKVNGTIANDRSETLNISILSTYNLVAGAKRDFCVNGHFNGHLQNLLVPKRTP